ncbi:MAG: hypothetical protein PUP91_39315 [Rhizonema sp. PD37]|nr:hypothetical protein [Rhizonema sp. PD37]
MDGVRSVFVGIIGLHFNPIRIHSSMERISLSKRKPLGIAARIRIVLTHTLSFLGMEEGLIPDALDYQSVINT